ncbi:GAF domain-containing protein [Phormidium tenue FACHB-886]|nr:GAF domain-containing protein [Phormidium tenue FACHB-886]
MYDLQRANEIVESFSGYLEPEAIAHQTTEGLIDRFNCVFARIWLMEPDQAALRLVASSGLSTRLNGSFARVPLGAYKVGKIAQNRVAFLSNHLAEEAWVKDREWAIANGIRGFAGFPLLVGDRGSTDASVRVIGVLAAFSRSVLTPEFLEVLQGLCTTVAIVLETATRYQVRLQTQRQQQILELPTATGTVALSDQLAALLGSVRLTLIGTEQPLTLPYHYVFLQAVEVLKSMGCSHCRLIYQTEFVALEAGVVASQASTSSEDWVQSHSGILPLMVACLGGILQSQVGANQRVIQVLIKLPYPRSILRTLVQIRCRQPVLQLAFRQLAYTAGLQIDSSNRQDVPLLTDDATQIGTAQRTVWIQQGADRVPSGINAVVDLSITPEQLQQVIEAVERGEFWGISAVDDTPSPSEREREILGLLAQGLRDRDIAQQLVISESTVKFHLNNVLSKLKARTRFQALHDAVKKGWI